MGARERAAALGSHAGSRRGERGAVTERPEARPAKLAKAGARQAGGRGTGGARWGPTGTWRRAPIRDRPLGCPLRAPRPRRRARTCALQPAMWQPGGGGLGAAADGVPRPSGPTGKALKAQPRSPGAGVSAPRALTQLRCRSGGRGRAGAGCRLPRPAHSPPPWPCARGRRRPRQESPDTGSCAHWLRPPPVRRSAGAGPGAGGAWSGRGAGGAQ